MMSSLRHRLVSVVVVAFLLFIAGILFNSSKTRRVAMTTNDDRPEAASVIESVAKGNRSTAAAAAAAADGEVSVADLVRGMGVGGHFVVPNVVHFIWFDVERRLNFTFLNYISILSVHRIQHPDLILVHCNREPNGKWWALLRRQVSLRIFHRDPPRHVFGQPIKVVFHASDVTKFELMLTYGGIFLDTDVIVVNSLDPLRVYNATLGKEIPPKLIAGIMLAAPGAEFFRLVYDSYRDNYRGNDWDYNCARLPYLIYLNHSHLLHVEKTKLTTPDYLRRHHLFGEIIDWKRLYVVHVMAHDLPPETFQPENMRTARSTLGEVIRFIYYGSPDVRTQH